MDTAPGGEKEKVSLTLDRSVVQEIRSSAGPRSLSSQINELLRAALAQRRLAELVDDLERAAGPATPEAYDTVLNQWFAQG